MAALIPHKMIFLSQLQGSGKLSRKSAWDTEPRWPITHSQTPVNLQEVPCVSFRIHYDKGLRESTRIILHHLIVWVRRLLNRLEKSSSRLYERDSSRIWWSWILGGQNEKPFLSLDNRSNLGSTTDRRNNRGAWVRGKLWCCSKRQSRRTDRRRITSHYLLLCLHGVKVPTFQIPDKGHNNIHSIWQTKCFLHMKSNLALDLED